MRTATQSKLWQAVANIKELTPRRHILRAAVTTRTRRSQFNGRRRWCSATASQSRWRGERNRSLLPHSPYLCAISEGAKLITSSKAKRRRVNTLCSTSSAYKSLHVAARANGPDSSDQAGAEAAALECQRLCDAGLAAGDHGAVRIRCAVMNRLQLQCLTMLH